jgi:hypothetical protein
MKDTRHYAKLAGAMLAAWFVLAIAAGALGVLHAGSPLAFHPPLGLGLFVALPLLLFAVGYTLSPGFRQFVLALDARTLTILHSWRLGGFVFLILYAHGILPGRFALPAGWGDISIGATAWLAATYLTGRRAAYITWQLLGVADLVIAVTMGVLSSPGPVGVLAGGVTTDAMSTLPLSLVPTFAVPLLLTFHFVAVAQARRWASSARYPVLSTQTNG